jgi:adenine/guanine phosphoribosyltransferase-like PRPP-binding protein
MAWQRMTEQEWREHFFRALDDIEASQFDFVTGAGRSGAVAAVYASHYLGLPFKPHKSGNYTDDSAVLIVDTVEYTGKTLRKAKSWYERKGLIAVTAYAIKEEHGHYFKMWYE